MSYTDGPWKREENLITNGYKSIAMVLNPTSLDAGNLLGSMYQGKEEKEANTLLIAAAPDLAKVVIMLLEHLMFPNKHHITQIEEAAREALTKAQVLK